MKLCLVIDDFEADRILTARVASDIGLSVIKISNGKEGLEICKNKSPQVVLLDWRMQGMDGEEFIRDLRQQPFGKNVLVIMCSGISDSNKIKQAIKAGVDAYLTKPVEKDKLKEKLTKLGLFDY